MTPTLARIKRAVRQAVSLCGGVDGAGATAQRSRSVAGDWGNLNSAVFPPADCALALDEALVAMGHPPEILRSMASELGFALIPLPEGLAAQGELGLLLMDVVQETGELATRVRDALADGRVEGLEPASIEQEADDLIERAALIKAHARALQGKIIDVPSGAGRGAIVRRGEEA